MCDGRGHTQPGWGGKIPLSYYSGFVVASLLLGNLLELVLVTAGLLSPLLSWASHSQIPSFHQYNIFLLNPTGNTSYS